MAACECLAEPPVFHLPPPPDLSLIWHLISDEPYEAESTNLQPLRGISDDEEKSGGESLARALRANRLRVEPVHLHLRRLLPDPTGSADQPLTRAHLAHRSSYPPITMHIGDLQDTKMSCPTSKAAQRALNSAQLSARICELSLLIANSVTQPEPGAR
ncbi:hypothetical protein ANCCEY_09616 [Ancylostoma ceylanicum]|uniref:Uncharacterized protein n=1 Tax=Ancylostoma ceylanicum TaxID=53326 RepID=A0A0D6LJC8_9BILA|nr:hypothetical protein ANCCEY_09616 [Ancylostoma ceylanicum]